MADKIDFSLVGIEELSNKLESVIYDVKKKGGRSALRKAANVIKEKIKQNAMPFDDPVTGEKIYLNAGIRWNGRLFKRSGDLGFRIGILGGAKQYVDSSKNRRAGRVGETYFHAGDKSRPGGDTWYWRLIEFGTSKVPARPFVRPALAQNVAAVTNEFIANYDKALFRAIKRGEKYKVKK